MYAYVICRLDISYAITFLACFSNHPDEAHYRALKNVTRYLRRTKSWGLMYWRSSPNSSLPHIPFTTLSPDPSLPSFPSLSPTQLTGFHDAAHATDLEHRRSVTGYHFMFSGAAIAFRTTLQQIVALSSTEAEFYSAILTAKTAKYFCSILHELGFTQHDPTPIYGDNKAAIQMINENKPTQRY